jgi:hypothetical protein
MGFDRGTERWYNKLNYISEKKENTMAQKYPGLYLYFDWLRGLEKMPPKIAMQIICNLFHYAEEGREPAPLSETHYEIVQDLYLEQIKRSKRTSEVRRASAFARYRDPNNPLPYMDITDPEELRRALESDPDYRNDDIDELVNIRMLMLEKNKKSGEETE